MAEAQTWAKSPVPAEREVLHSREKQEELTGAATPRTVESWTAPALPLVCCVILATLLTHLSLNFKYLFF